MHVLIVDDDEISCLLLTEILEQEGITAAWITNSPAGYDMAVHGDYDLFIVDVRMPLLAGTELARRLKINKPHAPVVLISAFADDALRETATSLGVALLSKPFSPSSLIEAMANILGRPEESSKPSLASRNHLWSCLMDSPLVTTALHEPPLSGSPSGVPRSSQAR